MATKSLFFNYRPIRIGFLIEENIDDLVQVSGINALLWGGLSNPIIPVNNQLENAEILIRKQLVDVLFSIRESNLINKLLQKFPYLKHPHHHKEKIFYEDYYSKKNEVGFLDSINIINYFWEDYIKNQSKNFQSAVTLIKWDEKDILSNIFAINFGFFPSSYNLKYDFEKAYLKGLCAKEIKIPKNKSVPGGITSYDYPLLLTLSLLSNYKKDFIENGFFLGDHNSFEDIICFWNLRASGDKILFIPKEYLNRFSDLVISYLKEIESIPNRFKDFNNPIIINYGNFKVDEVKEIFESFKCKNPYQYRKFNMESLSYVKPSFFQFDFSNAIANIDKGYERYQVSINLPEKYFIKGKDKDREDQSLVSSINILGDFEYPFHTLKVPPIYDLNEFFSREIVYDPYKLRVEDSSFGVITDVRDNLINLYPLPNQELIYKIFKFVSLDVGLSSDGIITNRIIEKLGGLEDGRVLKIYGVRKLLKDLKIGEFITKGDATKTIYQNDLFKKYEKLVIERRNKPKINTTDVFNYLLKKEFFSAGLELVCDYCNSSSFLSLKVLDDFWDCPYCNFRNKTSLQLNNRGDWKFRKSGLFSREGNEKGAIPVILTLLQLKRRFDNLIYSSSLNINGNSINCEIDFCVLVLKKDFEICIGECKSDGGEIDDKDIDNLLRIQKSFKNNNINCYLLFSKTADSFTLKEIESFKILSNDKNNPIIFTNKELEPYEPYGECDKNNLTYPYPFSLYEVAINSRDLYLK